MENFGKLMAWIIALVVSPIVNGFVIVKMWSWFIVTTFHADPLRIVEAIGIGYLIGFLSYQKHDNTESSDISQLIILTIIKASFFLLAGWVVSKFM